MEIRFVLTQPLPGNDLTRVCASAVFLQRGTALQMRSMTEDDG